MSTYFLRGHDPPLQTWSAQDGIAARLRKHGFSEPSYYAWKAKFGGMKVSDAQRLKALESENGKLKRLLANSMLEVDAMREVLRA